MDQISRLEVVLYLFFLEQPEEWYAPREIAEASKINQRTVRGHMAQFFRSGLVDRVLVFLLSKKL
jgi:predicted DNA-binding transcriptional regulator